MNRSEDLKATFPGPKSEAGSALKLVEIARGACDAYPRVGPTSEWDIAAAEAVVMAAGGIVRVFGAGPVAYNKADSVLNPFFWAAVSPKARWRALRCNCCLRLSSGLRVSDDPRRRRR